MDHISFEGFFGTRMSLQFTWTGCRLRAGRAAGARPRAARPPGPRGRRGGAAAALGFFFKDPAGSRRAPPRRPVGRAGRRGARDGGSAMSARLGALVELVRLPAALTVPGRHPGRGGRRRPGWAAGAAVLPLASVCLYWAGMALNDWADRDLDAVERPERPIPSGRVAPRAGARAGRRAHRGRRRASPRSPAAAVRRARRGAAGRRRCGPTTRCSRSARAGPVAMAAARGLDVLLGARRPPARGRRARRGDRRRTPPASPLLSRGEVHGAAPRPRPALAAAPRAAGASPPPAASRSRGRGPLPRALAAPYAGTVGRAQAAAVASPTPATVRARHGRRHPRHDPAAGGAGRSDRSPAAAVGAARGRPGRAGGVAGWCRRHDPPLRLRHQRVAQPPARGRARGARRPRLRRGGADAWTIPTSTRSPPASPARTAAVRPRLDRLGLAVVVETGARYLLDPLPQAPPDAGRRTAGGGAADRLPAPRGRGRRRPRRRGGLVLVGDAARRHGRRDGLGAADRGRRAGAPAGRAARRGLRLRARAGHVRRHPRRGARAAPPARRSRRAAGHPRPRPHASASSPRARRDHPPRRRAARQRAGRRHGARRPRPPRARRGRTRPAGRAGGAGRRRLRRAWPRSSCPATPTTPPARPSGRWPTCARPRPRRRPAEVVRP